MEKVFDIVIMVVAILCLVVAIGSMLLASGCATATVHESVAADGAWECEASYTSGFKNFQDVQMQACSAKGGAKSSEAEQAMSLLGQSIIKALSNQQ